ncbi:MAG: hypothetical protein LBV80_01920 [Deltaproteobacteria bacterium]|jgi:hypothetical protein|nr:hypothetical protein [Deltaproteobacteria bacterium]
MSNVEYLGQSVDMLLGQEFLTWLWYRSETANKFKAGPDEEFSVFMEQRIVVQGGEGELIETASVSGAMSELREARLGLTTGKKVTRALIRLEQEPETWQLTLKAEDFSIGSLKTPKVEGGAEKDDDPDAIFFEKVYLLEKGLSFIDALYKEFLRLRLGSNWIEEVRDVQAWLYS